MSESMPLATISKRSSLRSSYLGSVFLIALSLTACDFDLTDILSGHGGGPPTPGGTSDAGTKPTDPCTATTCLTGSHCDLQAVQCVKAPCDPVPVCVPNAPNVMCGGIAGFACPGTGTCIDDPSDDCSPSKGGADCSGICQCTTKTTCPAGSTFDSSPKVCACVAKN